MTNHLTDEQRAIGRANAYAAIGGLETGPRAGYPTRRDFLVAAAAAGPALGALYFGYKPLGANQPAVKAVVIGTGNEGCDAMIRQSNRDYINYIGFCDARPYNQKRALDYFARQDLGQYTKSDIAALKNYGTIKEVLDDPEVEVVVIALPLWLHAPVAIDALKAGKHVFCEKLMAHDISECKAMIKAARENNRLLAIGHQRHYSAIYDNANALIRAGMLGDIRHIRASWHRNNGQLQFAKNDDGTIQRDDKGDPVILRDDDGNPLYYDSWKPPYMEGDDKVDLDAIAYKASDGKVYKCNNHDELVRWRLYDKTGAGLMAELGSHQLDACSIFLGKQHPLAVSGFGGTYYYQDGREVDDHVFVNFEFPKIGANLDSRGMPDTDERVVVSYSSITTNAFEDYGETVMGIYGTLMVSKEYDIYLYKEYDRNRPQDNWAGRSTTISVESGNALATSPSLAGPSQAQSLGAMAAGPGDLPSRGYREELEHFAYCIRNGDPSNYNGDTDHQPRCPGPVALADAVIALTSNLAMRHNARIEFKPEWFDPESPAVPEADFSGRLARGRA
ncbi:Gfo/Idh/MocA family protein [Tautonia marina]|uniref:Gfo/Idh/MocA family protein n=1 Tax=Tautonia marina TaxID=2653855 RepID=UPI0012606B64|nr:Gfo/Idh/MocA family oxidoreductase [Tautonia marina]